jgi:hypothetical protein
MYEKSIQDLKLSLLKSNWPKCNDIAKEICGYNNHEAKLALMEVLEKGERHHSRTAAIKALVNFKEPDVIEALEKRLDDPAYEPRVEAKNILKKLTGDDYTTPKGE